jgi:hypothetical protein
MKPRAQLLRQQNLYFILMPTSPQRLWLSKSPHDRCWFDGMIDHYQRIAKRIRLA